MLKKYNKKRRLVNFTRAKVQHSEQKYKFYSFFFIDSNFYITFATYNRIDDVYIQQGKKWVK